MGLASNHRIFSDFSIFSDIKYHIESRIKSAIESHIGSFIVRIRTDFFYTKNPLIALFSLLNSIFCPRAIHLENTTIPYEIPVAV